MVIRVFGARWSVNDGPQNKPRAANVRVVVNGRVHSAKMEPPQNYCAVGKNQSVIAAPVMPLEIRKEVPINLNDFQYDMVTTFPCHLDDMHITDEQIDSGNAR
jgi:hypothetical protein